MSKYLGLKISDESMERLEFLNEAYLKPSQRWVIETLIKERYDIVKGDQSEKL